MSYLARLKAKIAENAPQRELTKLPKVASVSFVSTQGKGFCQNAAADCPICAAESNIEDDAGPTGDVIPQVGLREINRRSRPLLAEERLPEVLTKLTKGTSVGFVNGRGSRFCEDEAAVQERAGMAADRVPAPYLDTWARLNCQRLFRVSEAEWRLALEDGGLFLDAWGKDAAALGWTPGALFDVAGGLVWRLCGERVEALGSEHVRLTDGRVLMLEEAVASARAFDGSLDQGW